MRKIEDIKKEIDIRIVGNPREVKQTLRAVLKRKKPKPVFIVKEIRGENIEDTCDQIWQNLSVEEKETYLAKNGWNI